MKIKLVQILYLMVATAILGSCKKDPDPQPAVQAIIPGEGLSDLMIGEKMQNAMDLYGTVNSSKTVAGDTITHYLAYYSKGIIVFSEPTMDPAFNAQMKIGHFGLGQLFTGKTDKQIGIGNTKAEVKAAYGDPSSSTAAGDKYDIGIIFLYDGSERVIQIDVI